MPNPEDMITREEVERKYVTKDAFEPVSKIVYGLMTLVAAGVAAALLKLVLK